MLKLQLRPVTLLYGVVTGLIFLENISNNLLRNTIPTSGGIEDVRHKLNEIAHSFATDTRISIRKPSMDDVFLALTAKEMEATLV